MPKSRSLTCFRRAAVVWSVGATVAHSDAGVSFPLSMLLFGALLLIAIGWLFALSIAVVTAQPERSRADAARAWVRVPLPMLAAFVLIWLAVPLRARLFLSGPALKQSAAYLSQLPQSQFQQQPPWVGLFRIREFSQFDGGELRFMTSSCGFVDNCGVVFAPGGRPPNRGEDSFEHLYGEWWHWHQSW